MGGSNLPPGVTDADIDRQYGTVEAIVTKTMLFHRFISEIKNGKTTKPFKEWLEEYRGQK